jgi:3-hydroxybutyryl-CoA dehydratase
MLGIRKKAIQGISIGDSFVVHRTFTHHDVQAFADISKDYNPVHFDGRFAAVKGFKKPICHGLLVAGMLTEIGGQLGWLASGMDFFFKKPIYVNEAISCRLTIDQIDARGRAKAHAVYTNPDGEIVLEATLTGIVPGAPERNVLRSMVEAGDPTNPLASDDTA